MSVLMRENSTGGIALIEAFPSDAMGKPLPTVILFHSFGVSKEVVSFLGYMIAARGLRCLMPEAPCHGTRFDGDGMARQRAFWEVCGHYVTEAAMLREAYRPLITDPDRIGVAGTSMGGFAALAATARYEWVGATASFMGSAYFRQISRSLFPPLGLYDASTAAAHEAAMEGVFDPSDRLDQLVGRPIYLWHGARDEVVHVSNPIQLQADLLAAGGAGKLKVSIDPLGSHRVTDAAAREGVTFIAEALDADPRSF